MKINKLHGIIFALLLSLGFADVDAQPRIAVLDFELMDMTLAPRLPAEIGRTASIKPMLENELKKIRLRLGVDQFGRSTTEKKLIGKGVESFTGKIVKPSTP